MKKRIASLAVCSAILVGTLSAYATSYPSDIAKSKYKDAIKYTYDNSVVTGYSDGTFRPSDTITRSEFAAIIARWRKLKLDKKADFADAKDSWASKEIAAVAKNGWMLGTGDGKFSPEEKISYIEALTVIVRAVGKKSEAEEFGGYPLGYSYTADRYGFTETITGGLESPIYRGAVSQIVYNSKDRFEAVEDGTEDSDTGLVDKLGVVKSYEFLDSRNIRVQKDTDLASAIEQLPREVYVLLESGQGVLIKVKWDLNSSYNKDVAGTYSVKGKVELPKGIKDTKKKIPTSLYGTVEVVEGEPDTTGEKIVNTYYEFSVSEHTADFGATLEEAKAKLPSKITLYLIGGGSVEADISWTIPGYNGLVSKKYDAVGKIVLPNGVVDRLGVVKDVKATLIVDSEPDELAVKSVTMLNALEYKITLNKLMGTLLPNTVTVTETISASNSKGQGPEVEKLSYGSSKKEIIVRLKVPLDQAKTYTFKVFDGEGNSAAGTPELKPSSNTIDRIIVSDNIIPADEPTKLNFKALNADGIDITESVRSSMDVVNTGGNKKADEFFNLPHNKVEFFYLKYKDKDNVTQKTPTYRIAGEIRRVVSIEDWTFGGDVAPDWNKTVKVLYKGGGDKKLYINPKDQFGDVGKVEFLKDEEVKVELSPSSLGSIGQGAIKPKNENAGANCNYASNSIAVLTPLVIGTGKLNIEIERAEGNFNVSLDIRVIEDSKSDIIFVEKKNITLSSSALLEYDEDRGETVKVKVIDQHGNPIEATEDIAASVEFSGEEDSIKAVKVDGRHDEFIITAKRGVSETAGKVKFTYVKDGKTMTTDMNVTVKSPGPVSYMGYIGFKEELKKGVDPDIPEKMEIKIYQYDKDGVAVKRVVENITAEIINKSGEEESKKEVNANTDGTVIISSSDIDINTVNTLLIKVGGITVLEEKFVVK